MVALHSQQRNRLTCPTQRFAWSHYQYKPTTIKTFKGDFSRFRLLNLKLNQSVVDIKMCINHIIILYNIFEATACSQLLFTIIAEKNHSKLKTLLLFVNRLPPVIPALGINTLNIPLDQELHKALQELV